ncbi:hypothetical protein RRF57_005533 [Xylaria bambusicola]|uniref:Extracelular serine carboxypeptidase n=1 Tax=Xylaria bambusicola TaxID=326684 RepID=A0AAN7UI27_9PEZI
MKPLPWWRQRSTLFKQVIESVTSHVKTSGMKLIISSKGSITFLRTNSHMCIKLLLSDTTLIRLTINRVRIVLPMISHKFTDRKQVGQSIFTSAEKQVILMEATNGLGVILENRYYGASYPFNTSTTDQLAFLTTAQTIADNSYFAQNAVFPGVEGNLTAPSTPWILYGGSLAGAQTAFSIKQYGDVLYGGIASSAPIHVVVGYPEWYNPIQKYAPQVSRRTFYYGLPSKRGVISRDSILFGSLPDISLINQDCVNRINNIVDKFDALVAKNNKVAIKKFKALFGLEVLTDNRDFAAAIADPIGNPGTYLSNTWQELNWNSTYGSRDFFYFCGNITDIDAPKEIAEVDHSMSIYTHGEPWPGLGGYANYIKQHTLPLCSSGNYNSNDCWSDSQEYEAWPNTRIREGKIGVLGQTSLTVALAPTCTRAALSRYRLTRISFDTVYYEMELGLTVAAREHTSMRLRKDRWAFPEGKYNRIPSTPDINVYNSFGDFNFSADRLAFIDGEQDVWNGLCYHSPLAPARRQTSDLHPELFITGSGHHWDSSGILDVQAEPQFIREAHLWEIRTVKKWLREFDSWKSSKISSGRRYAQTF